VDLIKFLSNWLTYKADNVKQGWGTCGQSEHLIWPASEFSLPVLEHNMASKRTSTISAAQCYEILIVVVSLFFSLLLPQPFNFSPVSFACNFQD